VKIDDPIPNLSGITGPSPVQRIGPVFDLFAAYGASPVQGPDQAEVSVMGLEIQRLTEQVKQLPDIREAKVQAIESRLAAGTYHAPVADIAEAMFRLSELDRDEA
jgi:anti-sigma28 factor (negative regulator of flagellin synthesis)